jgi:rhodanese-related sulfurtransferase
MVCICSIGITRVGTARDSAFARPLVAPQESAAVEFLTAEELKAKLARNQAVTILDVRATNNLVDSGSKIKGALHVKLRKLESRLRLPPLKYVARASEVIAYCACPNDEASIRAAQVLMNAGFKRVRVLKGGWSAWKKANGQVEARPRG